MVCTTVILLVVLCFICLLVFLRTTENRKKTPKKEGFTTDTCNTELTCPDGQVKHTIYKEDDRRKQSGCCKIQNHGRGEYFTNSNGCQECPTQLSEYSARLKSNQPTKIDSNLVTTSDQNTIISCYAICESQGSKAPYKQEYGMSGGNYYDTDKCDELIYYSKIRSNLYLETLSREISSNQSCTNKTETNADNNNTYCCSNDTWLRYNSNYNTNELHGRLGCCPSNQYLDDNGLCSNCPNNQLINTSTADKSGISACYITNCTLGPATAYHNNTSNSGYNCKSNYYYYSVSNPPLAGVTNTISEGSNDISFDGSNYFYPHEPASSNIKNTIRSNDFDTSSNWFYDNGYSNDNKIPLREKLTTTSYLQQPNYSNYYECSHETYLRCETSPGTPGTRSCICCGSNQYNSNGSCVDINSNTQEIADTNLNPNNKGECNPGWGKNGDDICIPCSNYEYSEGESNTCERCPHGKYPNSNQSACEDADGNLTQSNYRIKDTSTTSNQYLHYNNSNVFVKSASNILNYDDSSNMYVWEDKSTPTPTPTQYYLQVEDEVEDDQGNFLATETPGPGLNYTLEKTGSLTFNLIPYCPAGHYADGDSCSNCPAGTWSSTPGLEAESNCSYCPAGTWSSTTGLSNSSSCSNCPAGTWSADNGRTSNCTPCAAGTYSADNGRISNCSPCLAGTYSASNGSSNCSPCLAGTYSASNGSSNCSPCSAGTYSGIGSSECDELGNFNDPFHKNWGKQVNSSNTGLENIITGNNRDHWQDCYENSHCQAGAKCTRLDFDNRAGRCLPEGYPMAWCMDKNAVAHNETDQDYIEDDFKKNLFKCRYNGIFVNGTNDGGHFTLNLYDSGKTGLGSYGNRLAMTTCAYKWQTDSCSTPDKSCSIKRAGSTNSDCWEFKNEEWDDMVKNQEDCTLNRNEKSFMIKPVPGTPLNIPKVTVHGAHEFNNRCLKYTSSTDARMQMKPITPGPACQQFYLRNEGGDCSSSSSPPALAFPAGGSGR